MKKTIPFLLAVLMLTGMLIFSACGGGDADGAVETTTAPADIPKETSEPTETRLTSLPETMDFGGAEISILCRENEANTSYINEIGVLEESGDVLNDAIYRRNRSVEKRLNVVVNPINMDGYWSNQTAFMDKVRESVTSGDGTYDIVVGYAAYIPALAVEGMLLNLTGAPHIELDNPWWNKDIIESSSVAGRSYFLAGDIGLSYMNSTFIIYYNKQIAESLGIDDIYDTVKGGAWTRERVSADCRAAADDLNGDGILDFNDDRMGYVTNHTNEFMSAFGIRLTSHEGGIPKWDFNMDKLSDIAAWTCAFYYETEGVAPLDKISVTHEHALRCFAEGRSLYYCSHLGRMLYLRDMTDDFGVLPLFKWDEAQEEYSTRTADSISLFCVPAACKNFKAAAAAMEVLGEEGYYSVLPAYYDVSLLVKYVRDDESAEMLKLARKNVMFDFDITFGNMLGTLNLLNDLAKTKNNNFASYHASKINGWEANLTKAVETILALDE